MAEKVLIVHEDAEFVARIKVALAAVASDIQVANALSAIRAEGMLAQEKPDVLVVDAGLADRDGYEFAKAVKGVAETSGVPIVMVAPSGRRGGCFEGPVKRGRSAASVRWR